MISESRKNTIELMIKNYYGRLKIVGSTTLSLVDYLEECGLKDIELKYALEYEEFRQKVLYFKCY